MKKLIILIFFSLSLSELYSQESLSFEKIITIDSINKNDIYIKIKEWVGMTFVSAKNVIEVDDKDAGLLILSTLKDFNYGGMMYACYNGFLKCTIKIQIKDGRYKVIVTNFIHEVKKGNSPQCELGLITIDEECNKEATLNATRKFNNKLWLRLKSDSEIYASEIFEKINFSVSKAEKKDNW